MISQYHRAGLRRGLGGLLSGRINPQSAMLEGVSCVAYALVAGLIARIIDAVYVRGAIQ